MLLYSSVQWVLTQICIGKQHSNVHIDGTALLWWTRQNERVTGGDSNCAEAKCLFFFLHNTKQKRFLQRTRRKKRGFMCCCIFSFLYFYLSALIKLTEALRVVIQAVSWTLQQQSHTVVQDFLCLETDQSAGHSSLSSVYHIFLHRHFIDFFMVQTK